MNDNNPKIIHLGERDVILRNLRAHYYHRAGLNTEPALIFLHGWRSEARIWIPLLAHIALDANIYLLDLPGFGKSDTPRIPFDMGQYAEVVREFFDKLELRNVVLIGHSFGGRIAIKLATRERRVSRVVLVDSAGIRNARWWVTLFRFSTFILHPTFALPGVRKIRPWIYRMLGAEDYLATPELQATFVNVIREDLTPLLPRISQQTLIIWGKEDRETPLRLGVAMARAIPHARLSVFERAGHFSFLDNPQRFAVELSSFLA
ncbi:MAG: alpha/beta hydrolase [Candidatus Sungbacteria bacterium]|nr:alpha/beta hydrolase [Candidatus Sungbacteria bacterium]